MKNNYKINYLPIAVQDLENILDYIQTDNPSAAINLIDSIDNSISKLSIHPYIGVIPKDARLLRLNYRILIIKNYLVFYVVNESANEVEIRRVLSSRQKYEFLL